MNSTCSVINKGRAAVYFVVVLLTLSIVGGLAYLMQQWNAAPAVDSVRATERTKNLKELQAANADMLENYAWQDKTKGVVRIPVSKAMEIAMQEWKNPAAARSNLIERIEKATAVPPKAPEKPSAYE